jgi:hypothetical protein
MNTEIRLMPPRRKVRSRRVPGSPPPPIDLEPATAYEALTRQKVEALEDDLGDIKSRIDTIFYLVIGSFIVDMLSRWIGG